MANRTRFFSWFTILLLLAALLAGLVAGWWLRDTVLKRSAEERLLQQMVASCRSAHRLFALGETPSLEFPPDKIDIFRGLLRQRSRIELALDKFEEKGYTFLGSRLLPIRAQPSGYLVFENDGKRFGVFAIPNAKPSPVVPFSLREGQVPVLIGSRERYSIVIIGDYPSGQEDLFDTLFRAINDEAESGP